MHELSMAQGILNAVLETAEHNGATEVTEIVIEIGKLAMLNPEQVKLNVKNADLKELQILMMKIIMLLWCIVLNAPILE